MAKIIGGCASTTMPVPDWEQTNPMRADYIKNKPNMSDYMKAPEPDVSGNYRVPMVRHNGEQTYLTASMFPVEGAISSYGIGGRLRTQTPTENQHCANKEYVDKQIESVEVTIDQTYNPTSENAQSGKAVEEAIQSNIDQTGDPTSPRAQSGVAVAMAVDALIKTRTDEAYSPTSKNAQSGMAVAEALATVGSVELKPIFSHTVETPTKVLDVVFDKPLKEFWVRIKGRLTEEATVSNFVMAALVKGGEQYFVYKGNCNFPLNQDVVFTFHAKEVVPYEWETEFGENTMPAQLQGLDANTVVIRKSYSSRTSAAIKERYVPNIRVCDFQGRYYFAVGSTIEVYGLEG